MPSSSRIKLSPLTIIVGEELLIAIETQDAIRNEAFKQGYTERHSFQFDGNSNYSPLLEALSSMSLFDEKKIIEIWFPTGQPGSRQGPIALEELKRSVGDDVIAVITLPGDIKEYRSKAWYESLSEKADIVIARPVSRDELPNWIAKRAAKNGQHLSDDAVEYIANSTEGNLLACAQEINKLVLVCPKKEVELTDLINAISDVSRYSPQDLSEAILSGDAGKVAKIIDVLEAENVVIPSFLWMLNEDIKALIKIKNGDKRVWSRTGKEGLRLYESAARELTMARLESALRRYAGVERVSKGVIIPAKGIDPWQELKVAAVSLCRRRSQPSRTIKG